MAETLVLKSKAIGAVQELRAQGVDKLAEADAFREAIDAEGRPWTVEEEERYATLLQESADTRKEYEFEQLRIQTEGRRTAAAVERQAYNAIPTPQDVLTRGALSHITHMKANWTDDPQWGFRGHGAFAMAVYNRDMHGVRDERLDLITAYQAAMDHNVPNAGGVLLPPLHNTTIYNHMMGARTNLMALCDRYPLTGNLTIELVANAETSRVPGSRWGGVQSYWVEDGTAMTESQPKIRMLELRPRQLATMIKVTNTLLQNSAALEAFLDQAAVDDQIQTINAAILRGDGVGKPKGFLNSASLVTVLKEAAQAAATIVQQNILKMWSRLLDEDAGNILWLSNRDALPQVNAIAASGASGTIPVMLATRDGWPTMAIPGPMMLEGKAIRRLEQASTLGTIGDFILANMSGYALAYRARSEGTVDGEPAIQKDMSMHLEFDKNRTAFRYLIAVDGQTWLASRITPEQGTSELGHFIVIETRS